MYKNEIQKIDYSIIIPAYNEEKLLPETLNSVCDILKRLFGKFSGEIIVVDNNSTDKTAQIAEKFGASVIFESKNCIARARNKGAECAKGRFLIFLDADTIVSLDLVERALFSLSGGEVCGGGAFVGFEGEEGFFAKILSWLWNNLIIRIYPIAAGSFLFCRRDTWFECGGFDERYYASEEIHFSRALRKWGRKHSMFFRIIPLHVKTSSRKFRVYSKVQIFFKIFPLIIFPFLLRRKSSCSIWYERLKEKN